MSQEHSKQESIERLDLRLTERDLADFQRELAALQPASHLDREELLFRAGQESMRHGPLGRFGLVGRYGRWIWPSSTAALSLVCAGLLALVIVRGEPQFIDRVVHVPVYEPPDADTPSPSTSSSTLAGSSQATPSSVAGGLSAESAANTWYEASDYFRVQKSLATFGPPDMFGRLFSASNAPENNTPGNSGERPKPIQTPMPTHLGDGNGKGSGEGYLDERNKLLKSLP